MNPLVQSCKIIKLQNKEYQTHGPEISSPWLWFSLFQDFDGDLHLFGCFDRRHVGLRDIDAGYRRIGVFGGEAVGVFAGFVEFKGGFNGVHRRFCVFCFSLSRGAYWAQWALGRADVHGYRNKKCPERGDDAFRAGGLGGRCG